MPADDPIHLDQLDGPDRFRADLIVYLDSLLIGELAELLGELPGSRQQPLQLGVLMVALNERLPDAYKLLPPAGHPGPGEGRRHSLRQVVADRRDAGTSRHHDAPASGWPSGSPTANSRPTFMPTPPGQARWASGGWWRRYPRGPPTPTRWSSCAPVSTDPTSRPSCARCGAPCSSRSLANCRGIAPEPRYWAGGGGQQLSTRRVVPNGPLRSGS
jgi:hypothetical protein